MAEIQLCTVPHNDTSVDTKTMVVPKYYNAPANVPPSDTVATIAS